QLKRDLHHNEPKPELKKPTNTKNKAEEPQPDKIEAKTESSDSNQTAQTQQEIPPQEKTETIKIEDKQPETKQPEPTSEDKPKLEPTPPEVKPAPESTPPEVKPESVSPQVKSAPQK